MPYAVIVFIQTKNAETDFFILGFSVVKKLLQVLFQYSAYRQTRMGVVNEQIFKLSNAFFKQIVFYF